MASRPSSRREFLGQSLVAGSAIGSGLIANAVMASGLTGGHVKGPAEDAGDATTRSASEKINLAMIGVHGQGNAHIDEYLKRGDVNIVCVVDVDEEVGNKRCSEIAERQGKRPTWVADLRKMLEDKSIDCVSIATPNHWHALAAIWSMQAGKHVYVEKPVSHNVREGAAMVAWSKKTGKVCQTGTQMRSSKAVRDAIAFVQGGGIGKVKVARGLCYKDRKAIGDSGTYSPPSSVNYDLWLGPAPQAALTRPKLHYDWHWQWPYGNGDLGNQGIHQMDVCRWGLGVDRLPDRVVSYGGRLGYKDAGETANTQVVLFDYGPQSIVFEVRGLKSDPLRDVKVGVVLEGEAGYLLQTNDYFACLALNREGQVIKEFRGGEYGDHFANYLDAVRANDPTKLNAPIQQGHRSSALCHLGNISYRLGAAIGPDDLAAAATKWSWCSDENGQTLTRVLDHLRSNQVDPKATQLSLGQELKVDPATATLVGASADASAMLTRPYRAPFIVEDVA
jgi:predicted dehydrogenase